MRLKKFLLLECLVNAGKVIHFYSKKRLIFQGATNFNQINQDAFPVRGSKMAYMSLFHWNWHDCQDCYLLQLFDVQVNFFEVYQVQH